MKEVLGDTQWRRYTSRTLILIENYGWFLSSEFIVMGAGAVRCGRNREKTLTLNYIEVDCARSGARAFHGSGCRIIKTIKVPAL